MVVRSLVIFCLFIFVVNVFIIQDTFGYPWSFDFPLNFKFFLSLIIVCWNFLGIPLNMQIALGKKTIFTILSIIIHEHGSSSHLLVSSSLKDLIVYFLISKLDLFQHKYLRLLCVGCFFDFILGMLIVCKEDGFWYFCVNFVSCCLVVVGLSSRSSLVKSSKLLRYRIISLENMDFFLLSFLILSPLYILNVSLF